MGGGHDGAGPLDAYSEHYAYNGMMHVSLEFIDSDASGEAAQPQLRTRNLFGPSIDMILAQDSPASSDVQWVLTDHVGSVRDVIDQNADLLMHVVYDAFGFKVSGTGDLDIGFGFAGMQHDPESGLIYSRARYLNTKSGKYLSEDPGMGGLVDINGYRYANNTPLLKIDPTGRHPHEISPQDLDRIYSLTQILTTIIESRAASVPVPYLPGPFTMLEWAKNPRVASEHYDSIVAKLKNIRREAIGARIALEVMTQIQKAETCGTQDDARKATRREIEKYEAISNELWWDWLRLTSTKKFMEMLGHGTIQAL